jgi:lipopolysaccharide transport system ATP-binding protein
MSDVVIRAEKLGKKYLIGHKIHRERIFGEVLTRSVSNIWRKGIDLLHSQSVIEGDVIEDFWALRDVNFEISRGEVIGVIGHNGAGKTTLLKILSRIVEPTEGRVEIMGRVASLLEVGTGFHPELTGRENIFLNGAILGMSQREVRARMDEIVDFSGVEKFLDTPVKRYSDGMNARLAFAVAAHLETEVLFVDEVLAVGDAEFQARCLNRMSKVANDGRTVLFVSHNMAAITALTRRALVFRGGRLSFDGPIQEAVAHYAESLSRMSVERDWGKGTNATLIEAGLVDDSGMQTSHYEPGRPLRIRVVIETTGMPGMSLDVVLRDQHNLPIAYYSSSIFSHVSLPSAPGRYECVLSLAPYFLASGKYCFDLMTNYDRWHGDHQVDNAVRFTVELCNPEGIPFDFQQSLGQGTHAMRLSKPLQFLPVAEPMSAPAPQHANP